MDTMPLVYWGDPLTEQLCDAFDEVLAPVFASLDCFPAYLDPRTAPADWLDWLAGWIGLTVNGHEPARKRELITSGAALLPWQGTLRSVHDAVAAAFNAETEVIESGSATWSIKPDSQPAGQPVPSLVVCVTVDADDDIDPRSLDALVDSVKPAHIPHRVEVVIRPTSAPAVGGGGDEPPPDSGDGDETSKMPAGGGDETPAAGGSDGDKPSERGDL